MNVPVKKGMLLKHSGHLFFVEDVDEHHSGKQRPVFKVALRDVQDGRHISRTLDELMPIQSLPVAYRTLQYLFHRGDAYTFMDLETFDQTELSAAQLEGLAPFLREGQEIRALVAEGQIAHLDRPDSVVLKVADTAKAAHSVGSGGGIGMKEARLENGLEIRVPLFIKTGDAVQVSTHTQEYLGKASAD